MDDALNELATRLRRAVARLQRRLRASAVGTLSPAQVSILALLDKHESLTLGELASLELVRPPSITPLVRGLEATGLVSCAKDEADRRSTLVRLTPAGRQELDITRRVRTEYLAQRLLALSEADRRTAEDVVTFLEKLLEDS